MSNLSKQPPRSIPPLRAPPLRFGNSPSPDARNTSPFNKPTLPARRQRFVVGLPSKSPVTFQTGTDIHSIEVPTSNSRESMSPGPFRTGSIRLNRLSRENSRVFHSIDLTRPDFSSVKAEPDDAVTFQERLKTPLKDEKIVPEDLSPQSVVGDQAVTNFYSHYKKLSRVQDVNTFMQVRDAVYTSVLGKSESLGLLPSKIGFIKEKGDADVVQLNHFRLGDKYVEVLSEGIKSMKGFGKLELSNNRITPAGADALLSKLNNQTQVLNLAGNNIGKIGAEHLCSVINLKNSKLIEINLDGNKLGDNAVNQLCDAVAYSNSLQRLNLGKNFLSDNVADKLSHMLEYNSSLEELYLSWNQIKSAGGATLVAGLKSASKLRVLDLSWNALGQGGSMFSKNFASYIATNTTLVHLDLSNNYIAKPDATIIAEELKFNHTLYGFHFHGNVGYVDFKGFLVISEACSHSVAGRVIQPAINGVNFHSESLKHHIGNHGEYHDVCWICEGWRPIEMTWTPGKSGDGGREPIYCHLSFEGHKGIYLPKKAGFTKPRMVPPNQFDYFFTVDDAPVYANNLPYGKPTESQVKAKIGNDERELKVDKMNQCGKTTLFKMFGEEYEPLQIIKSYDIKPRMLDDPYIPPDVLIERPEWKYPVSIFRNFKPDNQAQLDECFRVDFENTRIAKIVKNPDDLQQVRNLLHECYRPLKDCYKHYAAIGAPSDIWSIPSNTFTELCQSCKIIDNKTVKLADFDRIFIATFTRADKDKNPRNPDRALVRYQFLEGLVRLAELKYVQTGTAPTYFDGVKMLLDESLMPYISRFNHQQWRQDRYWNEPVDTVYKSYFPIMRGVYKKYSGAKTLPGQKKFMCLEEFHKLLGDAGLFTDNFGERDATLGFSLAMMTQVDELNSDRIFQMQFVEFLEAFARCADKYSAHPYAYLIYNPQSGLPENEMSYEQRFAQSLEIKLEGLMPFLFAICENNVKELWAMPEASIFGMEEVDPRVRFSTKKKKIMRINPTGMNSIEPYDGFSALQM